MKIRRYKKVNKNLSFYMNNFGFRQPYQVLIDGTFCYAALNNKVNIADNLPRYLQGEIKLITTQCAVIEMEKLGNKLQGALLILKKYNIHKCEHERKPVAGSDCFRSMLGSNNSNHYIIATQDRDLQQAARGIPGAPLLYLYGKTPILEAPSEISCKTAKRKLLGIDTAQLEIIEELKQKNGLTQQEMKKKKRKKKGANPLSCKKKQKKPAENGVSKTNQSTTETEKKKRKRIRIPQHVREELLKK